MKSLYYVRQNIQIFYDILKWDNSQKISVNEISKQISKAKKMCLSALVMSPTFIKTKKL